MKAMRATPVNVQEISDISKSGLDAMHRSLTIFSEASGDLVGQVAEAGKKNAAMVFENIMKLATAKTISEAIEIQMSSSRAVAEVALNDIRNLSEAWARMIGVTSAPILEHTATAIGRAAHV